MYEVRVCSVSGPEEAPLVPTCLEFSHEVFFFFVRSDWSLDSHASPITYLLLSILKIISKLLLCPEWSYRLIRALETFLRLG